MSAGFSPIFVHFDKLSSVADPLGSFKSNSVVETFSYAEAVVLRLKIEFHPIFKMKQKRVSLDPGQLSFQLLVKSVFLFLLFVGVVAAQTSDEAGKNWHQFRGPDATGVSRTATPPIEWSEEKNVKWKVSIDGRGIGTPIIWGNKVFLLTAIKTDKVDKTLPAPNDQPKQNFFDIKTPNAFYQFVTLCLDRKTGQELWRQVSNEVIPHEGHHQDNDYASSSPTTDGKRLYCWFGSHGLYCYDLDGQKLWERDLGKAYVGSSLGEGCSPVIYKDKLVIVRDHQKQSKIYVLNAATGETIWEKDRDEKNAWATPRVLEVDGKPQIITSASKLARSYDLESGDIVWQTKGLTGNCIPCPLVDDQHVYLMSGYEGFSLLAVKLSAKGDVSDSDAIVWRQSEGTPYIPSPVLYDGMLFFSQSNRNIMTCLDAKTGKRLIDRTRLPRISNIYSSPVAANGHVYFFGRRGTSLVIRRADKLEVVATNKLNDQFDSSPAIAGGQLFIRGKKSLYCLEASE